MSTSKYSFTSMENQLTPFMKPLHYLQMELLVTTFEAVAVLIGIGVVGFVVIAREKMPESILPVLTPLVIDIALPCMIFANIISRFNPGTSSWWHMPLWWVGFTVAAFILAITFTLLSRTAYPREFAMSLFYQNAIFIPLAVLTGMFGADTERLVDLFLFTLLYPAFFFNTFHLFYKRKGKTSGIDEGIRWSRIFTPVLVATILAVVFKLTGTHALVPQFVVTIFRSIGSMTVPLIMIIIGGNIYVDLKTTEHFFLKDIIKFIVCKNILFPLITLLLLVAISPPFTVALIIMLQSATPPITAIPIMMDRTGGNRTVANQFFVTSMFASVITIPIIMLLFSQFFSS